jgi:hypothetical protein
MVARLKIVNTELVDVWGMLVDPGGIPTGPGVVAGEVCQLGGQLGVRQSMIFSPSTLSVQTAVDFVSSVTMEAPIEFTASTTGPYVCESADYSLGSSSPTTSPTTFPTTSPTASPTSSPTTSPTASPTASPTLAPTLAPTTSPTLSPMSGTAAGSSAVDTSATSSASSSYIAVGVAAFLAVAVAVVLLVRRHLRPSSLSTLSPSERRGDWHDDDNDNNNDNNNNNDDDDEVGALNRNGDHGSRAIKAPLAPLFGNYVNNAHCLPRGTGGDRDKTHTAGRSYEVSAGPVRLAAAGAHGSQHKSTDIANDLTSAAAPKEITRHALPAQTYHADETPIYARASHAQHQPNRSTASDFENEREVLIGGEGSNEHVYSRARSFPTVNVPDASGAGTSELSTNAADAESENDYTLIIGTGGLGADDDDDDNNDDDGPCNATTCPSGEDGDYDNLYAMATRDTISPIYARAKSSFRVKPLANDDDA